MPPGLDHTVYTPVASACVGGHFYSLDTMHLTEMSRDIDASHGTFVTNQLHGHALETVVRLMLALPHTSLERGVYRSSEHTVRTRLIVVPTDIPRRCVIALCVQVLDPNRYHAPGAPECTANFLRDAQILALGILEDMGLDLQGGHRELEDTVVGWRESGEPWRIKHERAKPYLEKM